MDIEHLYFYEVCRTKNMTQAARNLYISQSALSKAIKKIEDQLQVQLFNRNDKPLTLTSAGQIFLEETKQIRCAEVDFHHRLVDLKKAEQFTLHIGSSQYFNAYYLPPILKAFYRLHPLAKVKIIERNSQLLDSELVNGNIDISIRCNALDHENLKWQLVQQDELILAIPSALVSESDFKTVSSYLTSTESTDCQTPIKILKSLPFISLSSTNNLAVKIETICHKLGFIPNSKIESYQLETAFHMAVAGLGMTFVTNKIRDFYFGDQIRFIEINRVNAERSFYAYTRKDAYSSQYINDFIQLLSNKN